MSKVLKVSQGDYRLQVQNGGNIILDTGSNTGTVTITGNLDVKGTTTTVESTTVTVQDNILQLNYGQTGDGISNALGYQSGIEIERGTRSAAQFVFSEQITHYDSLTSSNVNGTFVLKTADGTLSGLALRTITTTTGADLIFDLQNSTRILRIANSADYAGDVGGTTSYNSGSANAIPNVQWVYDYVAASNGVASVTNIHYPTSGTEQSSIYATATTLDFEVAAVLKAQISNSGVSIEKLSLSNNLITTTINNLVLSAQSNNVEVNGILNLDNQVSTPVAVANTTKIYTKGSEGAGRTGIYLANTTPNSDELVSKNRALLFSVLF
jgi:hypothetical protein